MRDDGAVGGRRNISAGTDRRIAVGVRDLAEKVDRSIRCNRDATGGRSREIDTNRIVRLDRHGESQAAVIHITVDPGINRSAVGFVLHRIFWCKSVMTVMVTYIDVIAELS